MKLKSKYEPKEMDMVTYTQASTIEELEQILALQAQNLSTNISLEESQEQGFVTVKHDLLLLQLMNEPYGHIIAKASDQVIGYALVMLTSFKQHVPILASMFDRVANLTYDGSPLNELDYFVMGQVCVAKPYRGKGVFLSLYETLKDKMNHHFDLVITEVATQNKRSMSAHKKVGFQCLDCYAGADGKEWNILAWRW